MASTVDASPNLCTSIDGQTVAVPLVEGMEVLGAWIERNGSTVPSLEHRLSKAEKAFWADKGVLLNKAVPLN
eukprot:2759443-Karenia_brevis.AAC.1